MGTVIIYDNLEIGYIDKNGNSVFYIDEDSNQIGYIIENK